MKHRTTLLFLLTFLLLLTIFPASAQDELPFQLATETPIIERGETNTWRAGYNEPGAVIYYDGLFHLFHNGFRTFPTDQNGIGYWTSEDGIEWTLMQEDPILSAADLPYKTLYVGANTILVEEDADGNPQWVLYFYTYDTNDWPPRRGGIGRATASDPLGEWTVEPERVFEPDEDKRAWDGRSLREAYILPVEDGYFMYYTGHQQAGTSAIGLATSDDGITWTRYADNPILVKDQDWEAVEVQMGRVFPDEDGWLMLYWSRSGIGVATSDDGIAWTKSEANPVFLPSAASVNNFGYTTSLLHDGMTYLFLESNSGGSGTVSILATTDIDLRTWGE